MRDGFGLTEAARRNLGAIHVLTKPGRCPSIRELAHHLGFSVGQHLVDAVNQLERLGMVTRRFRRSRTLALTARGLRALAVEEPKRCPRCQGLTFKRHSMAVCRRLLGQA